MGLVTRSAAVMAVLVATAACDRNEQDSPLTPQSEPQVYAAFDSTFASNPNRFFTQVERLGNPLVSEVMIEKREHEFHNIIVPAGDPFRFSDDLTAFVSQTAARPFAYAVAVTNALLGTGANPGDKLMVFPDRAPGVTAATANTATNMNVGWLTHVLAPNVGYGGRKLVGDDTVDKGLSVIFGAALGQTANQSPGLTTDNVSRNDATPTATFPYFPAPRQ